MRAAGAPLTSAIPDQITANALARRALGTDQIPHVGLCERADRGQIAIYRNHNVSRGYSSERVVILDFVASGGTGAQIGFGLSAAGAVGAGGAEVGDTGSLTDCVVLRYFLTPPKPTVRLDRRNEALIQLKRQV